jgi:WD40-like Beta Propeller Repeat
MTDDRSLERAARSWLETGPTEAPDRAVEAALLRIQTTSQERDWHVPWRNRPMTLTARLVAAAIAIAVVAVGGALVLRPGQSDIGAPSPTIHASVAPPTIAPQSPSVQPSAGLPDYSALPGRILMEHAGNAPDGSEDSADYHIDRRRFYWMDPATMTGRAATLFLPGQPAPGKVSGDVSRDQKKIVFQDPGDGTGEFIWTANLDGTGLKKIQTSCSARAACGDWQPAFDPTGTKVVFVRAQADSTILTIKDLVTGKETRLLSTENITSDNDAEQPAWSPDGTRIAFGRIHWSGPTPVSGTVSVVDIATDTVTVLPIQLNMPGDPHWSPDGSRLLVTDGPVSVAAVAFGDREATADVYSVKPDGTDLKRLTNMGGVITADYTPDGQHVLFFDNFFLMVRSDGTDPRPVNIRGDDLSELNVGFGYVGHWVDTP